ncbi:hypothetical protein MNR02_12715 [Shinella sp. H4-D48]|uniref:Lipoprotein n=1 Tax=Shinella sedimenti TaxID=2919913 RepID=A0ABT0CS49_9HYPH|nr:MULTISPECIES: hypothetical protein [Shinella]MCJ8151435.1 hypothetical protein [Shinella sedimenti]UNK39824.1 hypothetical protein MNR02_12715 [Shinella sp. H4-D48]
MTIRRFLGITLLATVAGCSQSDKPVNLGVTSDPSGIETATQQQTQVAVIQGSCPQVYLQDGTAVLQRYARGAKDDPQNLAYQVTLADTTRQCVINSSQLSITVMVQGRIVVGPAGASGTVNVPIRVSVLDGTNTLYTQLVQYPVTVPADGTAGQFIFKQDNIAVPGGSGGFTKVYVGFEDGPAKKRK